MTSLKYIAFIIAVALNACAISRQSDKGMSQTLQFIKENCAYEQANKSHKITQVLADTLMANKYKTFDALIGIQRKQVEKLIGRPDKNVSETTVIYKLGKCLSSMNCEEMFLTLIFSSEGICTKAELDMSLKPEVSPNKGMQRSAPNK